MRAWLVVGLWMAALPSCGSDATVSFSTSFGRVTADAACGPTGGQFPLRDEQGFTLTVIVTDETTIVRANGDFGACSDITAGSEVRVDGAEQDGRVDAQQVQFLTN
jgi:hypothetical protein